jgi:protein-disulfide isomerase
MVDEITKIEKEVKRDFKKFFKNYWAIAAVILAVLLVIVLVYNSYSSISKSAAGQKVLDFAKQQGVNATIINVTSKGSVYEVVLSMTSNGQAQEVPVYITKDGKNLVPTLYPLTTDTSDTPDTSDQTQQTSQTVTQKSNKPIVELFVMAYCPYGTQMEKGIIPAVEALKDKIDFKIKFVYYAMHGQKEVNENTVQYCIQNEQNNKYLNYLTCFLNSSDSTSCLTKAGIDKTKLNSCVAAADKQFNITANFNNQSSWLSGQYPMYNVNLADNQKYQVGGSPTLVINGEEIQAARDPASLLATICSGFNTKPTECNTQLPSTTPSAGFGYDASASGSTTAQCG